MVSEINKYRLSSLIEVLCFVFSGIEFRKLVVDGMKEFGKCQFYGVELLIQEVCICGMDF